MNAVYLNDWKDSQFFGMVSEFFGVYISKAEYEAETCPDKNESYWLKRKLEMKDALDSDQMRGVEVILASYTCEDYSGSAFVLFRKDGQLFEVDGSHCSCYGLEGQWEPEQTTVEALRHRLNKGTLGDSCWGGSEFAEELRALLPEIEERPA